MPKNHNSAGRTAKNYDPSYAKGGAKGGPKQGARSPGHRGFRADEAGAAPKKNRWNADERAARAAGGSERPAYGDRPQRSNDRPAYGDRPARGNDRPSYNNDRGDRPARGNDRPAYNNDRSERPAYGQRSERPAYGDRPARGNDRPSYNNDRGDRPAYGGDRSQRNERPSYGDRPQRNERPSYGDRPERSERPAYGAGSERPAYNADRAPRRDVADRADRPRRNFEERPPRRDNFDRPGFQKSERSDSSFYPKRDFSGTAGKGHFTPQDDVVLERLEAEAIQASDVVGMSFGDLGLGGNIVAALAELGAPSPFPIQAATIPDVLAGKDVLGRGKTGSGKTIAFGAPLVEKLMENGGGKKRAMGRKPRALILAPTRELALQIDRTVQPIARSVGLFTTQIYGGVPQHRQVGALQRGVDIIVGTPGRIEDLIEQGRLDLSEVTITVLDEADHMCDLGFLEPVQRILRETADDGQKLLFSATLDKGVAQLVKEFLPEPSVHEVAGEDQASSTIDHRVLVIEQRDKGRIIEQLADRNGKTLVFARTRAFAEQLAEQLDDAGIPAVSLHGDLNQARRTRNLAQLTSGRVSVLVATDVAARGIHVDDIDLVIQADAPDEYKTYLHRSGRTGRAGKQGIVVTLIPKQRQRRMAELLERAEIEADFVVSFPGDELVSQIAGHTPINA
ncbi:MAG: DEAD/DEAH box helicase [Microterricola sp.]